MYHAQTFKVTLPKANLKKDAPTTSTSTPSIGTPPFGTPPSAQTSMSHEFTKAVISSPLRLPSQLLVNEASPSPKGTTDVGKRASKPIKNHNMPTKTMPNSISLPIFHSSVPTSLIGVPARTLATISNRHNIYPIWSQCLPGLHKLTPNSVSTKLFSPRHLLGGSLKNLLPTTKSANPTSPSRTRAIKNITHSLPITVTFAAAKVSPQKTGDLHLNTVELAAATMTRAGPEKRASSETLQGHARRPRIQLTNGRQSQK